MTAYVALLRGINVGGGSRVEMALLREVVAASGCEGVRTYINSGNVLLRDGRPRARLAADLERAIEDAFGFRVPVLLRDRATMRRLCDAIPATWANDAEQRTDVFFLWDAVDRPDLRDSLVIDPARENVLHVAGAIVWNLLRRDATRSNAMRLVRSPLYRQTTIRNVNTVRRLRDLLEEAG